MVKYQVKAKSPLPFVFFAIGLAASYMLPLENWAQQTVFGIAVGVTSAFVNRGGVSRSFEPADAPAAQKRKAVALLAIVKLVFGFLLILIGAFALADWLAPAFLFAGGYYAGTTAATPLRERDFA